MSIAQKMTAQLQEKASAELGVPVLGVGAVNVVGTLGYLTANAIGDVVTDTVLGTRVTVRGLPRDAIRRADGPSTKLPSAFGLAVTADHVVVYDVRFGPFSKVKIKSELGRFDRRGLQLAVQENTVSTLYHLSSPSQGQEMMFEMLGGSAGGSEYTRELAGLIRGH